MAVWGVENLSAKKIRAYTDDSYAPPFFERIADKINNNIDFKAHRNPAPCNNKMERIIKSALEIVKCDKIVIIADGEGDPNSRLKSIKTHIPKKYADNIDIIIFPIEVEEWICRSLGIKYSVKPSASLEEWTANKKGHKNRYKKSDLPRYADNINFDKIKEHPAFVKFVRALKDC